MDPAARFLSDRPDDGGGGAAEDHISTPRLEDEHDDDEEGVPCVLDIFVHDARGIHNICIYGDQDVYARLALTSSRDDDSAAARTTRVARGAGASPRFHQRLLPPLRVGRVAVDVLKCELWMRSGCARGGVLDDQLLGFALVPLAAVAAADGASIVEGEFELSSTDLLQSPAGTVRLSLALRPGVPEDGGDDAPGCAGAAHAEPSSSIASEVVILAPAPAPPVSPVDYSRIEFADLRVEQENHAMAVQYLPFLRAGVGDGVPARPPEPVTVAPADYREMTTSPRGEKSAASSDGSTSRNAAASTASTVSEDRAISSSADAADTPLPPPPHNTASTTAPVSRRSPDTPTSRGGKGAAKAGDVFASLRGDMDVDIDMEAEQSAMQRQIMEMYVKSMQQFSESLAKMQLPIDLSGLDGVGGGVQEEVTPDNDNSTVIERPQQAKKDGARVFYGSRAFF